MTLVVAALFSLSIAEVVAASSSPNDAGTLLLGIAAVVTAVGGIIGLWLKYLRDTRRMEPSPTRASDVVRNAAGPAAAITALAQVVDEQAAELVHMRAEVDECHGERAQLRGEVAGLAQVVTELRDRLGQERA